MCLLQLPGYPKRDDQEPLSYWVDVQADLSLCWLHRSCNRFCRALAHLSFRLVSRSAVRLPGGAAHGHILGNVTNCESLSTCTVRI